VRITVTHAGWTLLDLFFLERYDEPDRPGFGFAAEPAEEP
jgi:hypothetical protein